MGEQPLFSLFWEIFEEQQPRSCCCPSSTLQFEGGYCGLVDKSRVAEAAVRGVRLAMSKFDLSSSFTAEIRSGDTGRPGFRYTSQAKYVGRDYFHWP